MTACPQPESIPPNLTAAPCLIRLRLIGRQARLHGFGAHGGAIAGFLDGFAKATGKRLVFYPPCAPEQSFDEAWLLNLFDAIRTADTDRYIFAMRSRISRKDAAALHFLACRVAHGMDVDDRSPQIETNQPAPLTLAAK